MNWPLVLCLLTLAAGASFVVGRLTAPGQLYVKRYPDGTISIPEELFEDALPLPSPRLVREGCWRCVRQNRCCCPEVRQPAPETRK